ncbi:MAG TPA: hypothetical protein VG223_07395 [Solirubrobacteraceae bacterium]|nr:hypothetical protein [Solirubrobacteraceae bacterium]
MKFLRTAPTRRLLAILAGVLVVIGGGTAIAVAAAGSGPVPQPASLAEAIHDGLSAPKITGISANITFTNHLIDASNLQGTDPILQGAGGRLWYSPATHQLRLELQSDNGDAQVLVNGNSFWISDPSSNTVYEGTLPAQSHSDHAPAAQDTIPSLTQIQTDLTKLAGHLDLGGAVPTDTAGQPTYTVRVSPKHDGGLLGAAQLAFDAARGVPLDLAVYASGDTSPVLELKATGVSFGTVAPSVFAVTPPAGDKIVKIDTPTTANATGQHTGHKLITGLASVIAALPFTLAAPSTAAGLPRQTVAKLDWGGKAGALVTYGQGVGGIAVIERPADGTATIGASSSGHNGLSLPTVSIDGITARELDTALGTMIMFTRAGVSYTVIGSVPPTAAETAATDIVKAL